MHMKLVAVLFFALLAGASKQPAAGQCLALASLEQLGVEAVSPGSTPPAIVSQVLASTDWQYLGPVGNTKELTWNSTATSKATPTLRLSLRPLLGRYDVVLKTADASCVRQLRQELSARKLKPEPVTCPGCLGQRYRLPEGATLSFYSGMKGDYPLVVVFHPAETPAAAKAAATQNP